MTAASDRGGATRATTPAVTAVVTSHDAKATLGRCLESLRSAGPIAEILLFDSASTDGCADGLPPDVVVEKLATNVGPCVTRNLGLRKAESPRVLFVDDDMILEPGLVERLARALDDNPRAALAGPTVVFAAVRSHPVCRRTGALRRPAASPPARRARRPRSRRRRPSTSSPRGASSRTATACSRSGASTRTTSSSRKTSTSRSGCGRRATTS